MFPPDKPEQSLCSCLNPQAFGPYFLSLSSQGQLATSSEYWCLHSWPKWSTDTQQRKHLLKKPFNDIFAQGETSRRIWLSQKGRSFSVHVATGVSSSRLLATASLSLDLTPRVSFWCWRKVQQRFPALTKHCLLHVLCAHGTSSPGNQGWVGTPPKQLWRYRDHLVGPHTWPTVIPCTPLWIVSARELLKLQL